jgi:hypothetical protein
MQEASAMLADSTTIQAYKIDLAQSFLRAAQKICAWRRNFKASSPKRVFWAVPSQMHNPADDGFQDLLFPFALEFESLDAAVPMILSAGVLLQILSTILLLVPNSELDESSWNHEEFEQEYGPGPLILVMAEAMARFICQTMEYCHRKDMGSLGPQCTWHSQWSLGEYFRRNGRQRELEWVRGLKEMSGPNIRRGMMMMAVTED